MARRRNPNRDKAYQIWLEHSGSITNRRIAEMLNENEKVVAVWKQRDKWNVVQQSKTNDVQQKKDKKVGAPIGNQNAKGNKGGLGGPPGNTKAVKHGLFAKYLPPDTLELVEALEKEDEIAKLKRNIAVLETQIIRAQKIMNVESKEELIKQLKKAVDSDTSSTREWEFQYAWDRQGNFLSSLARAMTSLTGMYKLLAELQPQDPDQNVKEQVGNFVDALTGTAEEVWEDEEEA